MKILVPLDSSPQADLILDELAKGKWSNDTAFRCISVVETPSSEEANREYVHQGKIILANRVESFRQKLPDFVSLSFDLLEGTVATTILKEAEDWKADLIVLGSHGDTGKRRDSLGSVAAAVVNAADCSVNVFKIRRPAPHPQTA